ncbi:unnamed protein product [Heterotrigona itama]|uniref:Uncharacterized protein n=1 Tax=Heterotrigona itama TaxID=395501 RepID=A0A6V7GWK9_9HYME|nr:unnamed protein product [Heterotrigona itama]
MIVDAMWRRNVLCFLWITTILRIQGFVAGDADPAILSGTDLAHFQQINERCSTERVYVGPMNNENQLIEIPDKIIYFEWKETIELFHLYEPRRESSNPTGVY